MSRIYKETCLGQTRKHVQDRQEKLDNLKDNKLTKFQNKTLCKKVFDEIWDKEFSKNALGLELDIEEGGI